MAEQILTQKELIVELANYACTPDYDNIRFKEKIKQKLLNNVALLYALHDVNKESELFENGNINYDGDWSLYFGDNIRPYLFIPESQSESKNFLCYDVSFSETPKYNSKQEIKK